MSTVVIPERLIADVAAGNAAPFVGAGLSIGAGYPSWDEFCAELLAELGHEPPPEVRSNNLLIAQLYEQAYKRNALLERIKKRFLVEDRSPTACHELLARFGWTEVYTTNWDELLERSFQAVGRRANPIYSAAELATLESDQVGVVYLHGSPRRPETIAITAHDYHRSALYDGNLFARAGHKTLLFLGVSLTDDHLHRMRTESADRPSYAALFDCPPALVELYARAFNIHVIPLEAIGGNKTAAVAAFLEDLHEAVEKRLESKTQSRRAMDRKSKKFEASITALLHGDNAKSEHVWVINGVDFARYTNFFVDLIDLMQDVYSKSSLQIYNIYQPLHFFLDMLTEGEEHLRRALPELSKFLEGFSRTFLREEQLRMSAEFVNRVFPNGTFTSERAEETIRNLGRLLFPSLERIDGFAAKNPDRFVRTTVLSNDHDGLTSANHFRLFDLLMRTSERHFLVNADEFRTYAKTRHVHGSDFCLWENDEAVAVTDYYPNSHTLIVGWVYKEEERVDPGAQRYVGYFQDIYRNLAKFQNRLPIDQYIVNLEYRQQSGDSEP